MIAIESEVFVEGIAGEEIFDFLLDPTDEDYQRWWPGTHLRLHALERGENHIGDVFFMDEYIGERRVRMTGVVEEVERGRRIVWRVGRRVSLPVRLTLEMKDRDGGVALRHTIRAGFDGVGRILDPLFRLYFSPQFAADMDEHARTEFPKLRDLLSGSPEARGASRPASIQNGRKKSGRQQEKGQASTSRRSSDFLRRESHKVRLNACRKSKSMNTEKAQRLTRRFEDGRGKRVVFLSHCILNENTRYPGGACRACVREIVEQCLDAEVGMVQMPCPEQRAWGGVTKRLLLALYGMKGTPMFRLRRILLPLIVAYTRLVYRRMARRTAKEIADYIDSGYTVIGVVGIDGSPSCGVGKTLDLERSFDSLASVDTASITAEKMNAIVRRNLIVGSGLFTDALEEELRKRRIKVPFLAHDLIGELEGEKSSVDLFAAGDHSATGTGPPSRGG